MTKRYSYFRPARPRLINGYLVVAALVIFDLWVVGSVVVDAWRIWGPK